MKDRTEFIVIGLVCVLTVLSAATVVWAQFGDLNNVGDIFKNVERARKGLKFADLLGKSMEKFDPQAEHQLGRAVAANMLHEYGEYRDEKATAYINEVGSTLAKFCDMPEVFSGYHFAILDTDEVNAFAGPGAFIFVTRGMLRFCDDEAELACVLAHEIAHVQHRHAVRSIEKSRGTELVAFAGTAAAGEFVGGDAGQAFKAFEGLVEDSVKKISKVGYGKEYEKEADESAVTIARRAGYDPAAIIRVFEKMKQSKAKGGLFNTHPKPDDRLKEVREAIGVEALPAPPAIRAERFAAALAEARAESKK